MRPVGAELFQADRGTRDEANSLFSQFANAPKMRKVRGNKTEAQ